MSASQCSAILSRLQRGDTITPLDALNDPEIRSFRLSARVMELKREGHDIETVPITLSDGKKVAGYRLRVRLDGDQRVFA